MLPAVQDEHVSEIGICGVVADYAGEANLVGTVKDSEA
jgi:hypothetical protein